MVHQMYVMEVKKPNKSKAPKNYYHVLSTIPPEQPFQPLSLSLSKCPVLKK